MKKLLYIFFLLISFSCHSQFILIGKKICQLPQTSTISLYDWMVIEDSACATTHKMQVVDFLTACGINVDSTCVGSVFLKTDGSQTGALSSSQVFNLGVNTPIIKGNGTGVTVKDVSGAGIFINDSLSGDSISMAGGITNLTCQSTLVNKSPAILHLANYNSTLASTFRSLYNSAGTVGLTEWGDLSLRKNKTKVKLNDIDSSFLVHAHLKLDRLSEGSAADSLLTINGGEVKKIAVSPDWTLPGNTGTSPSTNFIGTTDSVDFVSRTNNTERIRITGNGNVGIGTSTPVAKLDVKGSIHSGSNLSARSSISIDSTHAGGITIYTGQVTLDSLDIQTGASNPILLPLPLSGSGYYYRAISFDIDYTYNGNPYPVSSVIALITYPDILEQFVWEGLDDSLSYWGSASVENPNENPRYSDNQTMAIYTGSDSAVGNGSIKCNYVIEKVKR